MNQKYKKKVFLDLDYSEKDDLDDKTRGLNELGIFLADRENIGKRAKELGSQGILESARSVELYMEAKKLYILGLFSSSIMICRATVEYIANELFEVKLKDVKDPKLSNFICDSVNFRDIVEKFLFKNNIIVEKDRKLFHKIYDIGNKYIHPKKEPRDIKKDCKESIFYLKDLVLSLCDVLKDYDIVNGELRKKDR